MSWHTSAVLIHEDFSDDLPGLLKKLGFADAQPEEEAVSFDDASSGSMEHLAVACVGGWTCLFSCFALFMMNDKGLAKIAKTADVFSMNLEGTTGAAGFEWWSGGKKLREHMVMEGEVSINKGKPLPVEKEVFSKTADDEQRVLLLMEKLAVPVNRLSKARFAVFSCDE